MVNSFDMFAQINHVAIISHQYNTLGKFYEAVFGLKTAGKGRPASAITIGDGYVGLNLIPRRDGYVGGIDHFGNFAPRICADRLDAVAILAEHDFSLSFALDVNCLFNADRPAPELLP